MSLVTAAEQARCLALIGSGSPKRDEMLFSLARKLIWTTAQRALINQIWDEEKTKREEARMKKQAAVIVLAAGMVFGLSGCMTTFEKRLTDASGSLTVIEETRERNPFINWLAPEWMNVRGERITRDGVVVVDRTCRENYETLAHLECTETRGGRD